MVDLNAGYSRESALDDGLLLDASHVAIGKAKIPFPTAISRGLWDLPQVGRDWRRVEKVLWLAADDRWRRRGAIGRFEVGVGLHGAANPFVALVIVEPSVAHGRVVTYLSTHEEWDLRGPRAGSFYVM